MLPRLEGRPIQVRLKKSLGPHHSSTSIPRRVILLDAGILERRGEFERILIHELFHFGWVRLANAARHSWERLLAAEIRRGARGELGWSAEWRKSALRPGDVAGRTRRWREYACESFCDSAAWLYAGLGRHREFTLAPACRRARRAWFQQLLASGSISI